MPLGRLLVGVAQATQQRFPKRFTDELEAQRQPVMAEATRDRQCRRAIEVIGGGEAQARHTKTLPRHGSVESLWRDGKGWCGHRGAGEGIKVLPYLTQ